MTTKADHDAKMAELLSPGQTTESVQAYADELFSALESERAAHAQELAESCSCRDDYASDLARTKDELRAEESLRQQCAKALVAALERCEAAHISQLESRLAEATRQRDEACRFEDAVGVLVHDVCKRSQCGVPHGISESELVTRLLTLCEDREYAAASTPPPPAQPAARVETSDEELRRIGYEAYVADDDADPIGRCQDERRAIFAAGRAFERSRQAEGTSWILVTERRPRKNEAVIGYDRFYNRVGEAYDTGHNCDDGRPRLVFVDNDDCDITHWMPMPGRPSIPPAGEESR